MASPLPAPSRKLTAPRANLWAFAVVLLGSVWMERLPRTADGYFAFWAFLVAGATWLYYLNDGPWLDRRVSVTRALLRLGLLFLVGWTLLLLSMFVTPEITEQEAARWHLTNLSAARIVVLVGFVPFVEELVFRGFLYNALVVRGAVLAVLVTSAGDFGLHWIGHDLSYARAILAAAVISGLLRTWTRGLAAPFLFHATLNAAVVGTTLLPN